MISIAIHQPNYLPWLGYFHKIARADVFVFLDDVQFTKGGFTNRVKVLSPGGAKWLTVPVAVSLGDTIEEVRPKDGAWPEKHAEVLQNYYRKAPCFKEAFDEVRTMLLGVPEDGLATVNMHLIEALAGRLGLACEFRRSSEMSLSSASDDRLIEIVSQLAPTGGLYLSGQGGAKYQDPAKFEAAGLGFEYLEYAHPEYVQGADEFVPGLSLLDAVFHAGWDVARELVAGRAS